MQMYQEIQLNQDFLMWLIIKWQADWVGSQNQFYSIQRKESIPKGSLKFILINWNWQELSNLSKKMSNILPGNIKITIKWNNQNLSINKETVIKIAFPWQKTSRRLIKWTKVWNKRLLFK